MSKLITFDQLQSTAARIADVIDNAGAGASTAYIASDTSITVSGRKLSVNISEVADNSLELKSDGLHIDLSGKVDKVTGKGLSSNDFTTTEKNKLSNIAANAQVNVIETIKVNGTALTVSNKAVNITVTGGSSDISVAETSSGVQIKDGSTVLYTIPIMKE